MRDLMDGEVWRKKMTDGIDRMGEVEDIRVREGIEVIKKGLGSNWGEGCHLIDDRIVNTYVNVEVVRIIHSSILICFLFGVL
jgi:hypothetical protein